MIKKNLFKYSLNILTVLTGFAVIIFIVFPGTASIVELAITHPLIMLAIGITLLLWALMMLIVSSILLFSESKREEAFFKTSHTEARDELEEKAVSDAIKRTFIFNLAFLTFIFALSGFHFTHFTQENGKPGMSAGYSFFEEDTEESKKSIAKIINSLPDEKKAKLKSKGISLELTDNMVDNSQHLIPRSLFSPFGILCLILLQFIMFKLFLFLNLRALNAED